MKKSVSVLLAACLLAAAFSGCGSSSGTGANTGAPTAGSAAVREELTVVMNADAATLHPSDYSTTDEFNVGNQIYDTLLLPPTGASAELRPALAESWEISADGRSYTFKLRQDITFHDGSPMTAEDVKFSAELFQQSAFQGSAVDGLESVEILDSYTVRLTTDAVYAPFLENVSRMRVASKAYYDSAGAEDFAAKPIGTGAYKFVEHNLGSSIVLEAYEGHFRGAPAIKKITFRVLADDATIAISLQTKELDFVKINEANFANLEGVAGVKIMEVPESRFGFISMNHEKEPYKNPKFRQAVAYAIDRQNLIDLAMDGIGTVNSNLISPLRFGYSDDLPQYTHNPEKSKALLAEIGLQTPYDLGVMKIYDQYKTQAQVIQNDLAAVGLNVTLEIVERNTLLQSMFNGDITITMMSMVLEGSTQEYSLALTTPYLGMANNVRYSNPDIDAMFERAARTIDAGERFKIYNDIFRQVQEEAVFVALYNTVCLYAYNEELYVPELPLEGAFFVRDFYWTAS
jgi:peptide/nickel transport system substrate-binding protein